MTKYTISNPLDKTEAYEVEKEGLANTLATRAIKMLNSVEGKENCWVNLQLIEDGRVTNQCVSVSVQPDKTEIVSVVAINELELSTLLIFIGKLNGKEFKTFITHGIYSPLNEHLVAYNGRKPTVYEIKQYLMGNR